MGFIEALIGPIIAFFGERFGNRPQPYLRVDAWKDILVMDTYGGTTYADHAYIYAHNSGRHPFTVNEAGWEAADGEVSSANRRTVLIQPGHTDERFKLYVSALRAFSEAHGALRRPYVVLAGETKRRTGKAPADWAEQLLTPRSR